MLRNARAVAGKRCVQDWQEYFRYWRDDLYYPVLCEGLLKDYNNTPRAQSTVLWLMVHLVLRQYRRDFLTALVSWPGLIFFLSLLTRLPTRNINASIEKYLQSKNGYPYSSDKKPNI